jgi:hypothetical protein
MMAFQLATEDSVIETNYTALNICIVGAPKIGKSTFASQIGEDGSVYFAATEKGLSFLKVRKTDVVSWKVFAEMSQALQAQKKYKHLVIDVIDNLYEMASEYVCDLNKVKSISDLPFGSGWTLVKKIMISEFQKLNNAGIGITFITHTKDKEIKKDSIVWTATCTSMPNSIEEKILGMCDLILFCYMNKNSHRMMRTKPSKWIHAAGDRSGKLPEEMPMDAKQLLKELTKQ